MAKMTVTFSLDPEMDKKLVRWLDDQPERGRSRAIREGLAAYLGGNGISLSDIYELLLEIRRCGVAVAQDKTQDDDPDLAEAMANLAKLRMR